MEFYSQIVQAYDAIFPLNEKQLDFVEGALGGRLLSKSILDIGCGTGSLSIAMGRRSAKVRSFDFDEQMIRKAEEKRPQALDVRFQQGDMRQIDQLYPGISYDAVLCFGNTLVHLSSIDEVEDVFKQVANRLVDGGKFLLQIVNYDRVIKDMVDALPTIETDKYTFVRNYIHRPDGNIDFNTILSFDNQCIENTVTLLALKRADIEELLLKYFRNVTSYGAFNGDKWSEQSFHLVVEAEK